MVNRIANHNWIDNDKQFWVGIIIFTDNNVFIALLITQSIAALRREKQS